MTQRLIENDTEHARSSDLAKVLAVLEEQNNAFVAKSMNVEVLYRKNDGNLELVNQLSTEPPRFSARLNDDRVVCIPSLSSNKYHSSKVPRQIRVYSKISAMTLVQGFYGIADVGDPDIKHWALMEDLSPYKSVEQAIQTETLPKSLTERLKIAYELSKTVAYLHSVQILIKSMTDRNVMLRPIERSNFEPVVTNLEEAREVCIRTLGDKDSEYSHDCSFWSRRRDRLMIYVMKLLSMLRPRLIASQRTSGAWVCS